LPVIERTWKDYLPDYIHKVRGDEGIKTIRDDWWIIYGSAKIFKKERLTESFLKLQLEHGVPFIAIYFEENGKLKRYRPEGVVRSGSQILAYNGIARYVPEPPFGWVPRKFNSRIEFHETIKHFIEKYIKKYEEMGQPILLLYWALNALESYEKRKLSKLGLTRR
jgi:hypothetical protein